MAEEEYLDPPEEDLALALSSGPMSLRKLSLIIVQLIGRLTGHEKVCGQRWRSVDRRLTAIEKKIDAAIGAAGARETATQALVRRGLVGAVVFLVGVVGWLLVHGAPWAARG